MANWDPVATPPSSSDPDPDLYMVDQDDSLSVSSADGVLANDTDVDNILPTLPNAGLTAVLDTGPACGAGCTFTLYPDGSFDLTPNPAFAGNVTFTYHARDAGNPPPSLSPMSLQ